MNDRVFSYFGVTQESSQWTDWKWQYAHRITDVEGLAHVITLSEQEKQDIGLCLKRFRMAITPYFASLFDPEDPDCPLRRQSVPYIAEATSQPWEMVDPLHEDAYSPVSQIVHRYPDRVLLEATRHCAMYCRYCIRKRYVGEEDFRISEEEKSQAIDYISQTPQIRDVLISGGDPLTLDDDELEDLIARIRAIPHVEIIRIGTRVPSSLPMRITSDLLTMLKRYHPLWINVQFNHPRELSAEAESALAALANAGIPLGDQSVLLKGINDNTATIKELLLKLVKNRVRPYYLYQCDLCEGNEHFRTRVELGQQIMRELMGNVSGLALPKLMIDAPMGGGKIPIDPEYVLSLDEYQVVMQNFEDKQFIYLQPQRCQGNV